MQQKQFDRKARPRSGLFQAQAPAHLKQLCVVAEGREAPRSPRVVARKTVPRQWFQSNPQALFAMPALTL